MFDPRPTPIHDDHSSLGAAVDRMDRSVDRLEKVAVMLERLEVEGG